MAESRSEQFTEKLTRNPGRYQNGLAALVAVFSREVFIFLFLFDWDT